VASDEYRRIKHEFRTVREKYDFLKERHGEQGEELKQYKRMLRKYKDRNTQLQEHIDELKCLHSGLRNTLRPYQEVI
jgi:chromosome segregation ATPase